MFCAECGSTAFAETRLPGSDLVESLGWLLGGLPGWGVCAWRHALRTKHCGHCGSPTLARETRASATRQPSAPPSRALPIAGTTGVWPSHLRDPRERLRRGATCSSLWALGAAGLPELGVALAVAWLAAEAALALRHRSSAPSCDAWDSSGRPLRIEIA
jgi:hypothetical protein